MNKIKLSFAALVAVVGVSTALPVLAPQTAQAQSAASEITKGVNQVGGDTNTVTLQERIKTITNILLFVLGAIAVIVIVIGGIRYATSNGDASQTKAAKDTILYAVVGLVVAIIAYAIVQFVLTAFKVK
ncbi:hypothetical protein HY312_04630 [Candidatus Saccharibacteria bacterium]|nr:hypothetical protein [Candidatus Saccharibacteria bacterium]